jgi:CPA2 family monovalent cation:H+ antiporter-2
MDLLLDLTIIFAIAAVVLFATSRLRIPSVVGLLLAGLVAGPYGFALVKANEEVEVMAEIGILLLLFTIGMEFSLDKLLKSKRLILVGGGLQVAVTVALTAALAMLFGLGWREAIFIGLLFSLSSTAIVLHLLQEKGRMDSMHGKAALAILIFQDIAIIPMMLMVPYLAGAGGSGWSGVLDLLKGIALVALIILFARKVIPYILRLIVHSRNPQLFLLSILVICFATAFVTYELGLKLALGAFLAGLIISESEFSYDALKHVLPLKEIFTSIFFISIGMLLNTGFVFLNFWVVVLLTAAVLMLKIVIVTSIGLALRLSLRNALIVGLSICQVGEFAFVLSKTGNDVSLLSAGQYQVFLAVSIISMAVSPFIIVAAPRLATRITIHRWVRPVLRQLNIEPVGIRLHGSSAKDHLAIIGYGAGGRTLAEMARENGIPYTVVELKDKIVSQLQQEGEPAFGGTAADPEVLRNAAVGQARTIVICVHDPTATEAITKVTRRMNPNAHIIVRSQFTDEFDTLRRLGADEIVDERQEAAKQISDRTLLQFS